MAAITASLERSLRNCSLNHTTPAGSGFSSSSDAPDNFSDTALELNSNVSLPFHWEQCLDLKTGEVYYVNWSTGMKVKEDPRNSAAEAEYSGSGGGDFYYTDDEDGNSSGTKEDPRTSAAEAEYSGWGGGGDYYSDEEGDSTYGGSEGSSSESSPATRTEHVRNDHVLVVAGCKGCLMYFMVPKQVQECPKCAGQLLHFDRSDTASSDP